MQLQADVLQRPLIIQPAAEVSALGAALLAGNALGWWQEDAPAALASEGERITPQSSRQQQMQQNYKQWLEAVARCRFQPN